ncbi:PHD-like zinc-binding domain containing protein [Novymonas esmeraldas]|uniref:PHD-like zinc-binding domain containing protein n=1 Tax=Novymonas esmeraldas TaxID=1808958 RepID=A0AAW0F427_9TRYP
MSTTLSTTRTDAVTSPPSTKVAAPKKNTVDYIPSKLSYDTAIPVTILANRSEFIERCKPFDIIDGPNPLDEPETCESAVTTTANAPATARPPAVLPAHGSLSTSPARVNRRRSRSPLKSEKLQALKREGDRDHDGGDEHHDAAPPVTFTRPRRTAWAEEVLDGHRPYQLLRSRDLETRVRYVLDDADYEWCQQHHVAPESLQRGITYLEWAYASSLLRAATPPLAVVPGLSAAVATQGDDAVAVHEPGAATDGRASAPRRRATKEASGTGSAAAACICGLCSKPVQLLTSQQGSSHAEGVLGASAGIASSASSSATRRKGVRGGGDGGRSSAATPTSSVVNGNCGDHSGGTPALPCHDLQHKGLRCSDCGVVAHLRCWFLTESPRLPEAWVCDGCTNYAQHRKRSAGVCCMCGRPDGVLLPYVSSALKDDCDAAEAQPPPPQSVAANDGRSSAVALSDMVCHAVCALSMPELAIQPQETVLRRNGLVDMQRRPYVYALRRVGKHKYAMHCEFCQHGTGRCVQCSHPHCFEAMHASCAAAAHTVDCHAEAPFSSATGARAGARPSLTAAPLASAPTGTAGWVSCSPYCRKHYGYSVNNSAGSAALGDRAEAEALALDLTGLLTGGDGVTSPVVRKRGRGRPPVALVQQREAERGLIGKLRAYWLQRREQRRRSSAQLASEINARVRHIVAASLRPEIVKISATKVRLSHFLSLVPEWQWQLVSIVEGELPLPDEEYDDVQKYRKVAHTRRSGNTRGLYEKMCEGAVQLDLLCRATEIMKEQCRLRRTSVEQELTALRLLCGWP